MLNRDISQVEEILIFYRPCMTAVCIGRNSVAQVSKNKSSTFRWDGIKRWAVYFIES